MRGVRDVQMASKHSSEEAYFSDPEELKDHEENLPRGRRSKSVDFSGIVEYAEVPRYKRASKCKLHKMSGLEKVAIRMELNEYKLKEMRVHSASRKNTLFYQVGNKTVFEGHEALYRENDSLCGQTHMKENYKPRFGFLFKSFITK